MYELALKEIREGRLGFECWIRYYTDLRLFEIYVLLDARKFVKRKQHTRENEKKMTC